MAYRGAMKDKKPRKPRTLRKHISLSGGTFVVFAVRIARKKKTCDVVLTIHTGKEKEKT